MYKGFWEQSREQRAAGRDEMQRGSAGRVESRAPAETKRVSKERSKAREKTTSNDRLKLDLVRRALVLYIYSYIYIYIYIERERERATAIVVSHVESDFHEHANGCHKKRTSTRHSLEQLTRAIV